MRRFVLSLFLLSIIVANVEGQQLAATKSPDNSTVAYSERIELAIAHLKNKNYRQALKPLQAATTQDPNAAEAWNYLGLAHYQLKQFEKALHCYKQVVALSETALAHNNLGYSYLGLERYADAEASFRRAVSLDPASRSATLGLCIAYSGGNAPDVGVVQDHCSRALELNPETPTAHYMLGYAYFRGGQYAEALEQFEQSLALEPETANNHVAIGRAQLKLKRYQEALKSFALAQELEPSLAPSYSGEGVVYFEMKKYDEAIRAFKRATELNPDLAEARFNLGIACLIKTNRSCALEQYNYLKIIDSSLARDLFEGLFSERILDARKAQREPRR